MDGISELALVFVLLLFGLIAAVRLNLPPVAGMLLAGAIVGPHALGFIQNDNVIELFAEMGAILLLFLIGIEFSLSKIVKFGVRAIAIAFVKVTFVFVLVYEVCLLLGRTSIEAFIIGNIFAVTSTTLFAKLVAKSQKESADEINIMFAVLILEDILSIFMLTLVSSLPGGELNSLNINYFVLSIVKSLSILMIVYILIQRVIQSIFDYILNFKTEEMLVFASLSICALLTLLASLVGLEASIGAFLAGSLLASLKDSKRIEGSLMPFGLFFSSFFFLSMGMLVNLSALENSLAIVAILLVVSIVAKFVGISISTYLLGYRSRASFYAGLMMLTVGEFSLLIAKKAQPLIGFDIISAVSLSVFISALFSAIILKKEYSGSLYNFLNSNMPFTWVNYARRVSRYVHSIMVEFEPKGHFFVVFFSELRKIIVYGSVLIILNGGLFLILNVLEARGVLPIEGNSLFWGRIFLHSLLSVGFIIKLICSIDILDSEFLGVLRKSDRRYIPAGKRIVADAKNVVLLLVASELFPILIASLSLPEIFGAVSGILLIFAFLYAWDAFRQIHIIVKEARKKRDWKAKRTYKRMHVGILSFNI